MTYGQAYLSGWKETFNFIGRACLQQFWTIFLIYVLIAAASSIPGSVSRIIGKRMVFSQKKCQTLSLASSHTAG